MPTFSLRSPRLRGEGLCTCALALLLALSLAGCKSRKIETRKTVEETPRLASSISVADAKAGPQLVSGFHQLEDNAWRWTERQFSVALGTPAGASQNGAVLSLKLNVPPVVIEKLKSVSLTASIDGADLAPETYTKAGSYTFQREVPAGRVPPDVVRVDFRLDHAMQPAGGDLRELGVIVLGAGLAAK